MRRIKFYLFLLCLFAFNKTFAEEKGINYGIQAGLTYSKMASLGFLQGVNVGVTAEKHLKTNLYVNTSVCLTGKGGSGDIGVDIKSRAYYLSIPVHIGLKQTLSNSFKLFEEAGPYFNYGLFGKTTEIGKTHVYNMENEYSHEIIERRQYNTFSLAKRFDMGIGFRLGLFFKDKYSLSFGSDFPITPYYKSEGSKQFINNHIINLGYVF